MGLFPAQWKVAQIIVIQKPSKSAKLAESYRSISLLPIEIIRKTSTSKTLHNNREA